MTYTNALIHESSPYLLQHAHNPVNWLPWNDETIAQAQSENKLLLISVGYAACHWCHVMQHESFEDPLVAQLMNSNYVNVKVDREERPDVDQVYMNAVQLMTGRGGWPLNIIALPNGDPVWGGTYFKKNQWQEALSQISELYQKTPEKLLEYAQQLKQGINALNVVNLNLEAPNITIEFINEIVSQWQLKFDLNYGGNKGAPKFMMPNNYHFLLRYATQTNHKPIAEFVNTTLTNMAFGGIYDQLGGGFSRYAVDDKWHVPHFEKMLYDNAQLVSLYADAYLATKNELYAQIVTETLAFVSEHLTLDNGAFYTSFDADSLTKDGQLVEGAYYVWTKEILQQLLKDDFLLFSKYYNINNYGYWEHDNYILIKTTNDSEFAKTHHVSEEALHIKIKHWKQLLLKHREKRKKPRLDDKSLTSWNALMLTAFTDAYRVFNDERYLIIAIKNATFLLQNQCTSSGGLYHNYKLGKSTINGYLEDYATTINAFIVLYENTLDFSYLKKAEELTKYCFEYFFDSKSKLFFFTSKSDSKLVSRPIEYHDNVIPASNSIMAKNLFKLGHYFENESYNNTALTMLNNILPEIHTYPSGYSNWLDLMLNYALPYFEVAVVGNTAKTKISALNQYYIPNKLIAGSVNKDEQQALLNNRFLENDTYIYVCQNKTCNLPTNKIDSAIAYILPIKNE